jgi:HPt (histidine-containing phosphotransfer) domain-containing protein
MGDSSAGAGGEFKNKTEGIFSAAELRENFMGNMELVRSILVRFIERTERQIAEIPGLAERGDWETAVREAHTIKGSARNLSAPELGDAAMRWEAACKAGDPQAVRNLAPELAEAFARFRAAAEEFFGPQAEGEKE